MKTKKQTNEPTLIYVIHLNFKKQVGGVNCSFFFQLYFFACLELSFDVIDNVLINLESLHENVICNFWFRPKHRIRNCDDIGVLTAQSCNGNCLCSSNISLVVDETNGEYEHVNHLQNLCDVEVFGVGCDKTNLEATFQHC
jgi:hypothetical protein